MFRNVHSTLIIYGTYLIDFYKRKKNEFIAQVCKCKHLNNGFLYCLGYSYKVTRLANPINSDLMKTDKKTT